MFVVFVLLTPDNLKGTILNRIPISLIKCVNYLHCFGLHDSKVSIVFQCSQHTMHPGQHWVFNPSPLFQV